MAHVVANVTPPFGWTIYLDEDERRKVIDYLVQASYDANGTEPDIVRHWIRAGCVGFEQNSDEELVDELKSYADHDNFIELVGEFNGDERGYSERLTAWIEQEVAP